MAQFYTLEEAARVLGMDPEELKSKAQHREVRAFLDGGTWRFKSADIDELARKTGLGSDPEFSLSDPEFSNPSEIFGSESRDEINLSEFQLGVVPSDLGPKSMDIPAAGSISDADILLDDSLIPLGSGSGSSSHILGMEPAGKRPSDSDVRLVPDGPKGASDSDVQLSGEVPIVSARPSDSDVTLVQEGSGSFDALDAVGPGSDPSGETMLRPSPVGGGPIPHKADDSDDSDFELTPSSVIDALQPESGSDFELTALDGSDEFEATPRLRPSDSDVTGASAATTGVNIGKPSDSGIGLQSVGGFTYEDHDSIELTPLDESDGPTSAPPPKAKAAPEPKSDPSATALPIKAESQKDIFDDTDFEVDALELHNDDQTMQIDAQSDFDLEESESASEVFAIDEEDVDQNAATAMGPAVLEDSDAITGAIADEDVSGEMGGAGWEEEAAAASTPSRVTAAAPAAAGGLLSGGNPGAEWGGLWVGLLAVATILLLALSFITMDVVANLNGYEGSNAISSGLVKMIAGQGS